MKEIFDSYIENSFDDYQQAQFKLSQFTYNYQQYFPNNKSSQCLDIGIGRGEILTCMQQWGYPNYLGIDISPSTVEFCKSIGLPCYVVPDTVEWLAANKERFDVITLLDVLEHVKQDKIVIMLKHAYRALKPGGRLIIQVPNMQAPDSQLHRYNDITHLNGFTEHSLRQIFVTAHIADFSFHGFEGFTDSTSRVFFAKALRSLYWKYVRFIRRLTTNLNPQILHPVMYAVIIRNDSID